MDAAARDPVDATKTTTAVLLALTLASVDLRSLAAWLRSTRSRPPELSWECLPVLVTMFRKNVGAVPELGALRARAEALIAREDTRGVLALGFADPRYPPLLAQVADPPVVLWTRGDAALLDSPAVAVVGSRAASQAALEIARSLGRELAARGLLVVSGLARGVDGAAHIGALETGRTIAVLGGGVDKVYPPEHVPLADRIARAGVVISEFPPGTPARRQHFPRRNRIVSGLAAGVVVVEAGEKSGALITAREALEQGREVMVVPGLVTSGRNKGGHALLKDGAALIENADDVWAVLQATCWRIRPKPERAHAVATRVTPGTTAEAPPGDSLGSPAPTGKDTPMKSVAPPASWKPGEELELDDLTSLMADEPPVLLARLLEWELVGLVRRTPAGRFVRRS